MATYKEVMAELKKCGTAQNVKIYKRHGAQEPLFGVSYANFKKMKKKLKVDHKLALQLWKSKYHDARVLAMMIADPLQLTRSQLNSFVQDIQDPPVLVAFAGLVAKSKNPQPLLEKWMKSKKEFIKKCGFSTLSSMLRDGLFSDIKALEKYLKRIEKEIQSSPNSAKYSMNTALISIGLQSKKLNKLALGVAKRIGKVEVDHGETSCKTHDAVKYLQDKKILKRYGL